MSFSNQHHTPDRREFLKQTAGAAAVASLGLHCEAQAADRAEAERIDILPYLQNPTADGMTICFASIEADDVRVHWGQRADALNHTLPMTGTPISKVTWRTWKARIAGLEAGEKYFYRVSYRERGEAKQSEIYRFKPFDPRADHLRAVVYNDVHDRIATAEALVKHVQPDDFEFSILLGDMWNDPSLADNARRAFLNLEAYVRLFDGSNKPMLFVRGNHDVRGEFTSRLSHLFDFPLNDPTAPFEEQNAYYDFRLGPVWFIAPDSGEDESKRMDLFQPYRARQTKWLSELFANSPHRDASWRVLATHIPLFYRGYWDAAHSREMWMPVLAGGRIDASIVGHIHAWGQVPSGKEIVYVKNEGKANEMTIRHTPPFPTLVAGGPSLKEATVMFIQADAQRLDLRLVNVEGQEVERLTLTK